MSTPAVGLFVPLEPKGDQVTAVHDFLLVGRQLVEDEPLTLQWYAFKNQDKAEFAVFDAFAAEEGRQAHLNGKIAAALVANAPTLLASGPAISGVEILASKVKKGGSVTVGLRVLVEAKPDQIAAVKAFLTSAAPLAESEAFTPLWYAFQLHDAAGPTAKFGIIDFFADESGRNSHLTGEIAKALFSKVDEFFVGAPDVAKTEVVASWTP